MRPMIREDTWPIIDPFFREMPEAIGKLPTFQEALADRFNQVPKGIVQKIEATSDLDQLDQWLVQIITAKELEDIERLFQS